MGKGFTPLSEIDPAVCSLALPEYVDDSRIGIHLGRLGVLTTIGYLGDTRITSYFDEATSASPTVVGINSDGTAIAGGMGRASAQADLGRGIIGSKDDTASARRPDVNLAINMSEVTDRVRAAGAVRETKNWALAIDDALGVATRRAAWQHLVHRPVPRSERSTLFTTAILASIQGGADVFSAIGGFGPSAVGIILDVVSPIAAQNVMRIVDVAYTKSFKDICWSAVPGWHVDRAGMVSLLSRSMKLAKEI